MLTEPAQRIFLKDGRTLAYGIYGDTAGRPLYFLHGLPGCRLQAALVHKAAQAAGIRVVAPDRPGFGESPPQPARTIGGYSLDLAQLADHLGDRQFGVLGVSCGGPYALACASLLPDRVTFAATLSGIASLDQPRLQIGQLPPLRLMFLLARRHPALASPLLAMDRHLLLKNPAKALRSLASLLTEPDRRLLTADDAAGQIFAASLVEAYRQGIDGARTEATLIARGFDFSLSGIRTPVHLHQAGQDRHVPPAMGEWLHRTIPGSRLIHHPGEGHLSIVPHGFPECAAAFTAV